MNYTMADKNISAKRIVLLTLLMLMVISTSGCIDMIDGEDEKTVPREGRWGIYMMDLSTKEVELVYSTEMGMSSLDMDNGGERLVFSLKGGRETLDTTSEIHTIRTDGTDLKRLTHNDFFDTYPSFSPDGSMIAFLSMRNLTMDIYTMNSDGSGQSLLYDSGGHDSDVDWGVDLMVFTLDHRVWSIRPDGTGPTPITDPPDAGQWGTANLPMGDYDPRLSPDGTRVVFERLWNPNTPHGGYDIYVVDTDGTGETRLTNTGYAQGLPAWSDDGDRIVYIVAAMGERGVYDIYMMNADGTNNRNISPDYFPDTFLVHQAVFSWDGSGVFFIGEWWA